MSKLMKKYEVYFKITDTDGILKDGRIVVKAKDEEQAKEQGLMFIDDMYDHIGEVAIKDILFLDEFYE